MTQWEEFINGVPEEMWMTILVENDQPSSSNAIWTKHLVQEWINKSGVKVNEQYYQSLIALEAYKYFAHKYIMEKGNES